MAVTTVANPTILPIGNNDIRLPIAIWTFGITSAGNLTGGANEAHVQWSRRAPEQLISCEEIIPSISSSVAQNFYVSLVTGEFTVSGAVQSFRWIILGAALAAENTVAGPGSLLVPKIISNPKDDIFEVIVGVANTNGESLLLNAWGYIWGVAARNAPGGPQRPTV